MQEQIQAKKQFLDQFLVDYSDVDFTQIKSQTQLDNLAKNLIRDRLNTKSKINVVPVTKTKTVEKRKYTHKKDKVKKGDRIIELYYEKKYTVKNICQIMDINPQTVYSTVSRYNKKIREERSENVRQSS